MFSPLESWNHAHAELKGRLTPERLATLNIDAMTHDLDAAIDAFIAANVDIYRKENFL